MIGIALIFIFILIFFYQKYIYKRYKNLEEEKQNKISIKLLYIFLIFLPFFDISVGYLKTGIDIIKADQIQITDAGKKFKEDKEILEELSYYDMPNYIEKGSYYYYLSIDKNNEYYINFNCKNITNKEKEEIISIENEMKNKYKNIKIFKNSSEIIDNKYYNSCTKELLFYNPYNTISNSVSFNTILYPLKALYNPSYYISFDDYTLDDYIFGNEFFNIKYFIIPYTLFVLFIFIFSLIKTKYIKKTIYITTSLIFLPYFISTTIELINEYRIDIKEFKKDTIYESKYKEDLIKYNKNNKISDYYWSGSDYSNEHIEYINRTAAIYYLSREKKEQKNKITLYEKFEKRIEKKGNYMIKYVFFRDLNSDKIVIEKFNEIYKKNYSVESLFGFYEIYKK